MTCDVLFSSALCANRSFSSSTCHFAAQAQCFGRLRVLVAVPAQHSYWRNVGAEETVMVHVSKNARSKKSNPEIWGPRQVFVFRPPDAIHAVSPAQSLL